MQKVKNLCDIQKPNNSPVREKSETKKNLRSNEKPLQLQPAFLLSCQNLSNMHKKSKAFYGKTDQPPKQPFLPPWLKEMHAVDFGILGDIILLNNEDFAQNNHKKQKKAPKFH